MSVCARGNDNLLILANACDEKLAARRPPVFGCCWPRCPQTRLSTLRAVCDGKVCASLWPPLINIILIYAADWIEGIWLIHSIFSLLGGLLFLCGFIALRHKSCFISIWFIRAHGADCVLTWLDHQRFECGVADEYSSWRLRGMENCALGDWVREREPFLLCVASVRPRRTAANQEFYERNARGSIPHSWNRKCKSIKDLYNCFIDIGCMDQKLYCWYVHTNKLLYYIKNKNH